MRRFVIRIEDDGEGLEDGGAIAIEYVNAKDDENGVVLSDEVKHSVIITILVNALSNYISCTTGNFISALEVAMIICNDIIHGIIRRYKMNVNNQVLN